MDKPKHTPGPWVVDPESLRLASVVILGAEDGEPIRPLVADVWGKSGESKANARLIAATPELLDVLRRAAAFHDATLRGNRPPENELVLVRDMNAAIRKATGEE